MKRQEFVDYIAEKKGLTKKEAAEYVEVVFGSLSELILDGEDVHVRGFGVFGTKDRAPRKSCDMFGKDNTSGKKMVDVPASRKIYFKPGINIRNAVLEKYKKK